MERWDNNFSADDDKVSRKRNYLKIIKYVIITGFFSVAIEVLSVYIPSSVLNLEVVERSEVMGTMQTVSVRVSNNNFNTLNDVSVQFGDQGQTQQIGEMGPFYSVMISPPDSTDLNFTKVTVTANNGDIQVTKSR